MSFDRFIRRHWFACLLVAMHTLLVGMYAWIELDKAWNDMNSTMLVMVSLYVIDYPIHQLLRPLINGAESTGTYLVALALAGAAFWFAVGTAITYICRGTWNLIFSRRPAVELSH